MNYYSHNDYRDYLAHHGILGQRWGKRNGPPYPLGAADHSASEKRAGWRDSLKKKHQQKKTAKRIKKASTIVSRSLVNEEGKFTRKDETLDRDQPDVKRLPEIKKMWDDLSTARNELEAAYKEENKAIDAYNNLSYSDRKKLIDHAAYWNAWVVASNDKSLKYLEKIYKKQFQEGDFSPDGDDFAETPFNAFIGYSRYRDTSLPEYKGEYKHGQTGKALHNLHLAEYKAIDSLLGEYGDMKVSKINTFETVRRATFKALDNLYDNEFDFYEERQKFAKTYK